MNTLDATTGLREGTAIVENKSAQLLNIIKDLLDGKREFPEIEEVPQYMKPHRDRGEVLNIEVVDVTSVLRGLAKTSKVPNGESLSPIAGRPEELFADTLRGIFPEHEDGQLIDMISTLTLESQNK